VLAAGAIGEYTDGCVSRASVYIAVSIRRLLTIAGDAQCKALQLKALRCMFAGHVRALSGAQSRTALLVESVAFARVSRTCLARPLARNTLAVKQESMIKCLSPQICASVSTGIVKNAAAYPDGVLQNRRPQARDQRRLRLEDTLHMVNSPLP